jgi:hypothetical protein
LANGFVSESAEDFVSGCNAGCAAAIAVLVDAAAPEEGGTGFGSVTWETATTGCTETGSAAFDSGLGFVSCSAFVSLTLEMRPSTGGGAFLASE